MDEQRLTREIGLLGEAGLQRTDRCPDEHALAVIAAGTVSSEERARLTPHLAACDFCLARIGELARLNFEDAPEAAPDLLLARAAKLGAKPASAAIGVGARARVWAAAAVLLIGVAVLLDRPWIDSSIPVPEVRRVDPEAVRPQITWPTAGMSIDPHNAAVRWTPVTGSLYYDVQVLSDAGDVLWRQRVNESMWALPESLDLAPGQEYFLRVDAYLAEARSVSSHHVVFSIQMPNTEGLR